MTQEEREKMALTALRGTLWTQASYAFAKYVKERKERERDKYQSI